MNYLITGASGFIGRRLVGRLLEAGHTVNYLARQRPKNMDSRAAFFCWRENEPPPLDCVPSLHSIVHLAGEPVAQRWTDEAKRKIWSSRVDLTRSLVDAIGKLKHKPSTLVSASAIGYYGNRDAEILTERSSPGSDFLAGLCVKWEGEATRARSFGLRVVPVRIGIVLGTGGGALQSMLPLFRAGLGGRIGSGEQYLPWIHIDDLVSLLIFAASNEAVTGVLNASSPNPVRNSEFTRELAHAVGRPAVLPVPVFALRLALGPVADHIAASARVMPEETLEQGFQFRYPALASCLSELLSKRGQTSMSASKAS